MKKKVISVIGLTILTAVILLFFNSNQKVYSNTPPPIATATLVPDPAGTSSATSTTKPEKSDDIPVAWILLLATVLGALIQGIFSLISIRKKDKESNQALSDAQERIRDLEGKISLLAGFYALTEKPHPHGKGSIDSENEEAPPERGGAQPIKERMLEALNDIKIFEMPGPKDLDKLFVPVYLHEKEEFSNNLEEDAEIMTIEEEERLALLSQIRLSRMSKALSPEEALGRYRRLVILGEPGSGKTTLLKHIAVEMIMQEQTIFPVYLELQDYAKTKGNESLLDYAAEYYGDYYGLLNPKPGFEVLFDQGKAVLLLDGLDEARVGDSLEQANKAQERVIGFINRIAVTYPQLPIIVTCRRAGWTGNLDAFTVLEILDFDWSQIQTFIEKWFEGDRHTANELILELGKNTRMQILAGNPLLLSLIAIVFTTNSRLPEQQSKLYEDAVKALLERWDATRKKKRYTQFQPDHKRRLLIEVAYSFHSKRQRFFQREELIQEISTVLPDLGIRAENSEQILQEIATEHGLLRSHARETYRYPHLVLQEFFAASAVAAKVTKRMETLIANRYDPWWFEVIKILAGQLADISPLLTGILGYSNGKDYESVQDLLEDGTLLAKNDDIFHNHLLLAAQCLVGAPYVSVQGLRAKIIEEVKDLLYGYSSFTTIRAAKVLISIGNSVGYEELIAELLNLLEDSAQPDDLRKGLAVAFGEEGNELHIQHLIGLLSRPVTPNDPVRVQIIESLAARKAVSAVQALLGLLNHYEDWYLGRTALALGKIGDKRASIQLMSLLKDASSTKSRMHPGTKTRCAQAVSYLQDKSHARSLLSLMLASSTDSRVLAPLAEGLKTMKANELVPDMLWQLKLSSTPEAIKWLITEVLEGYREKAADELSEIMDDPSISWYARVGAAATLGTWGIKKGVTILCRALQAMTIEPDWEADFFNKTGYAWIRICRVLRGLGDQSVIKNLIDYYGAETNVSSSHAKAIALAAAVFKNESQILAIPRRIASQLETLTVESSGSKLTPLEAYKLSEQLEILRNFVTKALIPNVLPLLAVCPNIIRRATDRNVLTSYQNLISAVGMVAEDQGTIRVLQDLMQVDLLEDFVYEALYKISRRSKTIITKDFELVIIK